MLTAAAQLGRLSAPGVIVMGASVGAIEALKVLLPALPAATACPVVVVVHVPPRHPSLLCQLFAPLCALPVREPDDKEPLRPGIWFAPPDYHLLIEPDRTFALSIGEHVHGSRPSIDELFASASEAFGPAVCAVVLTGSSEDGARGAALVREAGGLVYVQDPTSARAPTLPAAALVRARPQLVADLAPLASALAALAVAPPAPEVSS